MKRTASLILALIVILSILPLHTFAATNRTQTGQAGPVILQQPEDAVVEIGKTAKVEVIADGEGLTYQWYLRNAGATRFTKSSVTSNYYDIKIKESRIGRQVYCVITDRYGNSVTSDTVRLTCPSSSKVTIVTQPKSVTVAKGEKAKVSLTAEGDGLTYEWYYKNAGASAFKKTNSFTGSTYRVEMTDARAGRQIYCVVTDRYGNQAKTNTVTLNMEAYAQIITQPESVTVARGQIAMVTFTAAGDGLTYEWYYKNAGASKFKKTDSFSGDTYKIEMNDARAERQIYCLITDRYGNQAKTDTVTLHMENKVRISVQPVSVTVEKGQMAKVTFRATGDGLTYVWYIRNADETAFRKSTAFSGNTYQVRMNETRAGRHLYCRVTDQYGNVMMTHIVAINMLGYTDEKPEESVPYVCDKLSWEQIQAFPIANDDMTTDELRELCLEFFLFSKSFAWTPSEDYEYIRTTTGKANYIEQGTIYGGFPYIHKGSGNVYRVMDFYDPETGVIDIEKVKEYPRYFGNQCSLGSYWGWARVVNSAQFGSTYDMVASKGFIPLGEYTYDESITEFGDGLNTEQICEDNGEQTIYESYACLKLADGLVAYENSGHVVMVSAEPVVVRNEDGTINGKESYIRIIDQSQTWKNMDQSNGDNYKVTKYINRKMTFAKLLKIYYIPFTFAEFLGTDPVEELEYQFDYSKASITVTQLLRTHIGANYGMSDVYVHVKDADGNLVYTTAKRLEAPSVTSTFLAGGVDEDTLRQYDNGKYTIEVVVQFANGERNTVYTGTLK